MANFEEKLIALSSAETLKKAKALLKHKQLCGAWRDRDGRLCGIFRENSQMEAEVAVSTGEAASAVCSCKDDGSGLCPHAIAMLMYSGRFRFAAGEVETPPVYSKGLLMQSFAELSRRGMKNSARLRLTVVEDQLHAPNQYKILLLSARLYGTSREYAGNLSNLRQLYFEKSLSAVLKYEDFSLHDQQIIRFLALNGEADNSNIALGAELTAELFHILPGFPRFFRDGKQIIVRPERAVAVLVKSGGLLLPGIRIGQAALPMSGARLIAGRGGSWVGKDDEYFFIGGDCEAGFLRSFFRTPARSVRELGEFPLPVCSAGAGTPQLRKAAVLLDGRWDESGGLQISFSYIYHSGGEMVLCAPRSGKTGIDGRDFYRRDVVWERNFENALALSGAEVADHDGSLRFADLRQAGVFLDRALPEILAAYPEHTVLTSFLAGLTNGGNHLPQLPFASSLAGRSEDAFIMDYRLGECGSAVAWETVLQLALARENYLRQGNRMWKISPALGKFFRSAGTLLRNIDSAGCRFEIPAGNCHYFCKLAGQIPGALPPELLLDMAGGGKAELQETFAFNGKLRAYQQEGVKFMQYLTDRSFNPLLADEMGLGKTVQLLALLSSRMSKNGSPSLIVCPASLVVNWAREAARFVPGFRVSSPMGSDREKELKDGNFDLLILSYAAVKLAQNLLRKYHFEFLVLDEAQHIKNPGSSNARFCKSIHASHRVVLTGTPLENSPEDLWSVMDFLQPGLFGSLPAFRRRYGNIAADAELQEEFTGRIAPFIKRRTKQEVAADLPEKHERIIYCEMLPEQRELYTGLLAENRHILENGSSAELFALLLRLRQSCCHPALLPDIPDGRQIPSAKTELLFEILQETIDSGHKVLVFSQFTSMLKLLIPQLDAAGIPYEYLDGSTRNRQERVDRFNSDPEIPLFLLSLKAGGTGLNLTAADTVIIYDPWWNPAVELQAADRTHRIGQTRAVSTIKLVMKNSVEERVLLLQQKKRELFQFLVENPAASGGMSLAELRSLME
ncbi:MAG: DEAD/DEAH box helicase [Lentisphaeria bacterium]|nr:DEAD/DEAH box helicase [Lentisphaeria bacterium]